uniref:LIM zinc-binding domain-containing protein n=1 Tax=Callorhinchus milii TaxID=7868 RepID=A0A4W3H480_CALMI
FRGRNAAANCADLVSGRPTDRLTDRLTRSVCPSLQAFEVAETELGIPALLDPDDMVAMRVPDRLSILTYVSQIYHCFNSQSQAGVPHSMKRSAKASPCEPSIKKPVVDTDEDSPLEGTDRVRRATLSSTCALCSRHVHLVQRYLVEGKLYHRNCFRCKECCNTLLPGAYKPGSQTGTFVCTHHHHKLTGSSQRPGFHRDGDSPAGSDETPGSREGGSTEGSPRLGGRADHRQHERGLPTPRPDAEGVKRGLSVKMLSSVFSGGGGRPPEGRTRSPLEPRGSPESGKAPGESAGQEERPAPAEPSKTPSSETDPRSSPPSGGREEASPEAGDCVQSTAAGEEKAGGSPGQSEASEQTSPSAEEAEVRVKPLPVPRKTVDMATSPSPTPRPTPRPRANLSDSPAQRGENGALVNGT